MNTHQDELQDFNSIEEQAVFTLYHQLIRGWNQHDASAFAMLFAEDGAVVGFDGSQINGKAMIDATLSAIFADHVTAPYIGKVKSVRLLTPEVALIRAIAGMIPVGQHDFNPHLHSIQTLIATKSQGQWNITLFQNTPAQFHGRADLVTAMTEELREVKKEKDQFEPNKFSGS